NLADFQRINPCGYAGQPITSLALLGADPDRQRCEQALLGQLQKQFHYTELRHAIALHDWYNDAHTDHAEMLSETTAHPSANNAANWPPAKSCVAPTRCA